MNNYTPYQLEEAAETVFTDMINENKFQLGFMLATEDPEDCEAMGSSLGLTWQRIHPPGSPRRGIQIWTFLAIKYDYFITPQSWKLLLTVQDVCPVPSR